MLLLPCACLDTLTAGSPPGNEAMDSGVSAPLDAGELPPPPSTDGGESGADGDDAGASGGGDAGSTTGPGPTDTGGDEGAGSGGADDGGDDGAGAAPDLPPSATLDPHANDLRIWQVLADPDGKDGGPGSPEFVEVRNLGDHAVDPSGIQLRAASWPDVDLGDHFTSMSAGESIVIFRFSSASPTPVTPAQATVITGGSGLRNADGVVALVGADTVDVLVYGGPSSEAHASPWSGPPAPDPGADEAFCRTTDELGAAPGASAWRICAPAPGANEPGAAPVVVREVRPASENTQIEKNNSFVEIENISSGEIQDLAFAVDGVDLPLVWIVGGPGCASDPCLPPGGLALIVDDDHTGSTADAAILTTASGRLGPTGRLEPDDPVAVRAVGIAGDPVSTYRAWSGASGPKPGVGQSAHRAAPTAVDLPNNWSLATPTPGK